MEQGQEGQFLQASTNGSRISFHSADIQKTESARPKEYFVKIVDSPESRRARAAANREQRRSDFKEWLGFYRKPIIISVVLVTIIMALLVTVALVIQANPIEANFVKNVSLQFEGANV